MDPRFERSTLAVEDRHWWYRGRRRVVRQVLGQLPLARGPRILDAGCGSGRNMEELRELGEVTGLELSEMSLEMARGRGVGEVVAGSVEAIPLDRDSFDLATSLDVIEHVADDRRAFRELARVVRPDGFLVVTVPAYPLLWGPHDEANHHRRRYTRSMLLAAATDAGWRPIRTTHFNSLLLPAAAAHRALQRLRADGRPPKSELEKTPPWLDGVLEQALRTEAALIATGRRIPAGLSLVGVFRSQ